ncbi:uncharacterized protein M421DRAFT_417320 [Didymella exigua CBS 183.55]|uniref:Uncharacterized protein n=1 Tax=Didymella exigua CBS 183.55 TaxID=1150837 RepID=A0A6A5RVK4_9PLEO|nr:uncharacterized protein M421DRAFT_417320 [Didymella exigua CBS 183.55]KAF1931553.1 hypothetical protein M421DRAFT_417320 [Didymella exigua CBS 183.55]
MSWRSSDLSHCLSVFSSSVYSLHSLLSAQVVSPSFCNFEGTGAIQASTSPSWQTPRTGRLSRASSFAQMVGDGICARRAPSSSVAARQTRVQMGATATVSAQRVGQVRLAVNLQVDRAVDRHRFGPASKRRRSGMRTFKD